MKKLLKFSGLISLGLAIVAFILMMVTPVIYKSGTTLGVNWESYYSGTCGIFGNGSYSLGDSGSKAVLDFSGTLAWSGLMSWIFALLAMIILATGVILPLLKERALDKFAGLLNLVSMGLLIVAGIFVFLTVPAFASANNFGENHGYGLGAGWIISAILLLIGGGFAVLPTAANFLGGKKK